MQTRSSKIPELRLPSLNAPFNRLWWIQWSDVSSIQEPAAMVNKKKLKLSKSVVTNCIYLFYRTCLHLMWWNIVWTKWMKPLKAHPLLPWVVLTTHKKFKILQHFETKRSSVHSLSITKLSKKRVIHIISCAVFLYSEWGELILSSAFVKLQKTCPGYHTREQLRRGSFDNGDSAGSGVNKNVGANHRLSISFHGEYVCD